MYQKELQWPNPVFDNLVIVAPSHANHRLWLERLSYVRALALGSRQKVKPAGKMLMFALKD
jgi:hypothetical protein